MAVERREKDGGICKARSGTRIRHWRRVTVEVGSARVKAIVRDEVERREKILRWVWQGEEFKDARIYVRGCRRDVWYGRRRDGGLCAISKDV